MSDDMTPIKNKPYVRVDEQAQVLQWPDEEFVKGRFVGPIQSVVMYWYVIKKKDGTKAKIGRVCLDYDPKTQSFVRDICPYRASGKGQMAQHYWTNFLVRELQDAWPRKKVKHTKQELKTKDLLNGYKCHIKEFSSKSYTPMRLVRLTSTLATKITNLKSLNVRKVKGEAKKFSIFDPKYGMDVQIMYNSKAKGAAQYDIQRDEKTALSEKELNYLMQPLQLLAFEPKTVKEAKKDWDELKEVLIDDDEGDDSKSSKSNKKSSKSGKSNNKREKNKDKRKERNKDRSDKKSSKKKSGKKKQFDDDWNL